MHVSVTVCVVLPRYIQSCYCVSVLTGGRGGGAAIVYSMHIASSGNEASVTCKSTALKHGPDVDICIHICMITHSFHITVLIPALEDDTPPPAHPGCTEAGPTHASHGGQGREENDCQGRVPSCEVWCSAMEYGGCREVLP